MAVECPQCGYTNDTVTGRCAKCQVDLEWALENWDKHITGPAESYPPLILQVNDEVGALTLCQIILTRCGYRVARANDAFEALEQIEHFVPDLIITDDMMPGMRGIEMISRLKDTPALQDVPIVMLSARGDHEAIHAALDAGATCFLSTPIQEHDLCAVVKSILTGETDLPKGCLRS